ncbi:glycoside hydrolase family 13 protein [Sporolactobacillus laevolacticus]|uniref:glycoside hydrolase family 13 protein n=1 Tax=Sporolactobacillus laevolacticus TaxID=33018 RepID=UPI0025B51614|nr:alpha-glucosidase [Sporolactobacillus laevolacticus]MDN3955052.1 alpha-glucosidase [Sporolactobacillus laevolacticus]
MKNDWWKQSVVYQIYPKSFLDSNHDGIGDLKGIIQKLDYIKLLGVDVIWLCPVYESPQVDNGYDISDYYQISKLYGSMDDMDTLIKESKARGIKIMVDLVVNHTSDQHPWFIESRKSKDNPYRDYYIWSDQPNDLTSNFGGSAWSYDEKTKQYYLHFYSEQQPDLNWENPDMRRAIYKMMNFWIEKGIGGFRMDVIDLIGKEPDKKIKENGPKLHDYLKEMNEYTFGPANLITVGETWGATPEIGHLYTDAGRKELNMVFQFEHMNLDKQPGKHRWDLKKLDLIDLKDVLSKWQDSFSEDGWNSLFWNNHDLPRIVSRWGNDREYRELSAKMLATLLHGMKGTPFIYQGEELGMTNTNFESIDDYPDIETQNMYKDRLATGFSKEEIMQSIHMKARDNARTPMQWNSSENAGFSTIQPWMKVNTNYRKVNVEQSLVDPDSVFFHYQKLIALRKEKDILIKGRYELVDHDNTQVYAYKRIMDDQELLIVCNFYETPADLHYSEGTKEEDIGILISNYPDSPRALDHLLLRPYEAVVYEFNKR